MRSTSDSWLRHCCCCSLLNCIMGQRRSKNFISSVKITLDHLRLELLVSSWLDTLSSRCIGMCLDEQSWSNINIGLCWQKVKKKKKLKKLFFSVWTNHVVYFRCVKNVWVCTFSAAFCLFVTLNEWALSVAVVVSCWSKLGDNLPRVKTLQLNLDTLRQADPCLLAGLSAIIYAVHTHTHTCTLSSLDARQAVLYMPYHNQSVFPY